MIRKVILISLVLAVGLWLAAAHIIKGRLSKSLEDMGSDNIKFSYQDTKISGLPFNWVVHFVSPKIDVTGQSEAYEIKIKEAVVSFDIMPRNMHINFGKSIECQRSRGELIQHYKLKSDDDILVDVVLNQPIYELESASHWESAFDSVEIYINSLKATENQIETFVLSGVNVKISKNRHDSLDKIMIDLAGDYSSLANYMKIKQANLLLNSAYLVNYSDENINFERKIEISKAKFKFDDSELALDGSLRLRSSSLPSGEVNISMLNYLNIIEVLVPDNFPIHKNYIQKAVTKASIIDANKIVDTNEKVQFKMRFDDRGISLGAINLMDVDFAK